jgi:DNA-binding beta-propeller fold protein YncE
MRCDRQDLTFYLFPQKYGLERSHTMKKRSVVLVSLAVLLGMAGSARSDDGNPKDPGQAENPVKAVAVSLSGGAERIGFDDIVYAPALHQVIVPAAQTGRVYLIDPATSSHESCAVWQGRTTSADAGDGYVFAADRSHSAVNVIDPKLHKVVASATLKMEPDIVRYVPGTHEVWVTEEDPQKGQVEILAFSAGANVMLSHVADVKVAGGGGPESLAVDPTRSRVYTNREDQKVTVAIDIPSRRIVAEWKSGTEGSSSGLALDETRAWLFVGSGAGGVAVLDVAHNGRILGTLKVGQGTDLIGYNPTLRHVYVPDPKEGTLAIIGVSPGGELRLLGTVQTAKGSHAAAADDRGQVWVTDPDHGRLLVVKDTL